jgi:hypothetical protein
MEHAMRVTFCETCGAPIDARWAEIVIVCRYCGSQNAPGGRFDPVPSSIPDDARPRLGVAGRTYLIEGLLAHGDSSEVFRGRWVRRLGELVVVKVLHALGDTDLMHREYRTLEHLRRCHTRGAEHFVRRLPRPIAIAPVRLGREARTVAVYGWNSGFVHTLEDVVTEHPHGVPGEVAVWIFNRLLELLAFIHEAGFVHAAVLPSHVLVHPRDHGAMLVGWSAAAEMAAGGTAPLTAVAAARRSYYPAAALNSRTLTRCTDIAMAARSVIFALGGADLKAPRTVPKEIGMLLEDAAKGLRDEAWPLLEEVAAVSQICFGPPSYHPLPMPGWPHQRT